MSPDYAREWVLKAEADRRAAERALADCRRRKDQAEIACFHAQQCAEKYLKAVLAQRGQIVPRVHDLLALARKLKAFGFPAASAQRHLRRLNQYAVEIRYPGRSAVIAEAEQALAAMEWTVKAAQRLLPRQR